MIGPRRPAIFIHSEEAQAGDVLSRYSTAASDAGWRIREGSDKADVSLLLRQRSGSRFMVEASMVTDPGRILPTQPRFWRPYSGRRGHYKQIFGEKPYTLLNAMLVELDDSTLMEAMRELLDYVVGPKVDDPAQSALALISQQVERLVADLYRDLEIENSDLRARLREAELEIAYLVGVVDALNEAGRRGDHKMIKAIVGVIITMLLAVPPGVAGNAIWAHVQEHPAVREYQPRCVQIQVEIDEHDQHAR